jgi:tripartite-type tricarboxylate transporter receptor subunit TctC
MKMTMAALAMMGVTAAQAAQPPAQFPTKPIRWIVDFPAGGVSDTLARAVGQPLSEVLGASIVVDNRPGANGMIAYELIAKAPADGYTLGLISTGFALNFSLQSKLPYARTDFAPLAMIATRPNALIAKAGLPAKNVKELIALAKQKPKALNYASVGIGSSPHLSGEMFKTVAGVDIVHVPYKGSGAALTDLIAGRVDLMFLTLPAALPHVQSGRLQIYAVTDTRRSPVLPNVPTTVESGLPGLIIIGWYGITLQRGVPASIAARYSTEINRILAQTDVKERIAHQGAEVRIMTPAEFNTFVDEDIARGAKAIRDSGTKAEG